ncbi:MAG: DUF4160 domain-containing protein [Desulfobacterales bacterium]|nr:DUF4160 domain-containing protein [Desulfobacterales bacterium]
MPVVFRYRGYRFFFYSNEGNPLEPLHIHVRKGDAVAKFWIVPDISVAESYGMSASELRELMHVIEKEKAKIERYWNEHFNIQTSG